MDVFNLYVLNGILQDTLTGIRLQELGKCTKMLRFCWCPLQFMIWATLEYKSQGGVKVLTPITEKSSVFWDVSPCSLVEGHRIFPCRKALPPSCSCLRASWLVD
jgi:hypothetical protein